MPSSYTPLGVELMVTGEQAGLWGDKTNTNLNILSQILGGFKAQAVNGTGDTPIAVSDGSTGATVAHRIIELTGTITGNITVSIALDVENFYIIKYLSSKILNDKADEYEKTIETEVKKRFKNLVLNEIDLIFNKKYKININREIYDRINKNTFQ